MKKTTLISLPDPFSCNVVDLSQLLDIDGIPFATNDSANHIIRHEGKQLTGAKMTVGDWKQAFATKLLNRSHGQWNEPDDTQTSIGVVVAMFSVQKEGLFVFGKPTYTTAFESPISSSPM